MDNKITLELPLETIGKIAIQAHEKNMKLNDYIIDVVKDYANKVNENEENPEFLTEEKIRRT